LAMAGIQTSSKGANGALRYKQMASVNYVLPGRGEGFAET